MKTKRNDTWRTYLVCHTCLDVWFPTKSRTVWVEQYYTLLRMKSNVQKNFTFFPTDLSLWFRALTSYKINPWRTKTMRALKRAYPHHQQQRGISEHWEHCPSCKTLTQQLSGSRHSCTRTSGSSNLTIATLTAEEPLQSWLPGVSKEFSKNASASMVISEQNVYLTFVRSVFLISAVTSWRVKPDSHKFVRSQREYVLLSLWGKTDLRWWQFSIFLFFFGLGDFLVTQSQTTKLNMLLQTATRCAELNCS